MIVIPAVDLREGACVQLVGGSFEQERVRLGDPMEAARAWERYGFSWLHVVDLDAATGRGSNLSIVRDLLAEATVPVQVGGGVRTEEYVDDLFDAGATRVVVAGVSTGSTTELFEVADDSCALGVDAIDFLTRTREALS